MLFSCWLGLVYVLFPLPATTASADGDRSPTSADAWGRCRSAEWRMAGHLFHHGDVVDFSRACRPAGGGRPALDLARSADGTIPASVDDATVAIAMAIVCFLLPQRGWRRTGAD